MVVSYVTVDCSAGRIETEACMEGIDGWVCLANDSSTMTVSTDIDMDHERSCSKIFPNRKHNLEHKISDESYAKCWKHMGGSLETRRGQHVSKVASWHRKTCILEASGREVRNATRPTRF